MKKIWCVLTAVCICLFALSGCGGDYATQFSEVNQLEGVTLSLQEDTLKSTSATFLLTNDSGEEVAYRLLYHLEELKDGQWEEFPGTAGASWGEETQSVAPGETTEVPINWKTLCGGIGSGEYRMILLVNDLPVAAEFTVD